MKLRFLITFIIALLIISSYESNDSNEGTCPSTEKSCSVKTKVKTGDEELTVEDISKENKGEKKTEDKTVKKEDIVYKSKKSGMKKENEPEPEKIDFPEDFQYQDLFMKWGERKRYLESFTFESNYTEYYDFNLDYEEIYSLQKERITIYPPKKFSKNFQGNFLHFYKVIYEKKLPVYLTTDSMLYAFNENLQNFQFIFYQEILPSFLEIFLKNIIHYTTELMDSPEGEQHKYFISHAQLFFATSLELLSKGIQTNKYLPAIETQLKSFVKKLESAKVEEFFMFYTKRVIDCSQMFPENYFSQSKILINLYRSIKWMQLNRFEYDPNNITPIWYLGKMIVDSGQYDLYKKIYDSLKFVMGMDSMTISIPDIYKLGLEIGYKDIFDLSKEQTDQLFKKVIENKKSLDLPYLVDNFLFTKEEIQAMKIEREFSSGIFDFYYDTEDWVKNKLAIPDPKRLRLMIHSYEIPTSIHQATNFKEYIKAKYEGKQINNEYNIPLRDGINLSIILERARYSIKDLMVFSPEKFRTCIKNWIHLLLYKASRRIKSSDPVFNKPFYKFKNFNIAYAGYVDFKREFNIFKSVLEMKKKEGEFADVVVEPKFDFYTEMLNITKAYRKMFEDLKYFGDVKLEAKSSPLFSNLGFGFAKLKGMFNHLEDSIQMLIDVIQKQESGVELDSDLKQILFDIVKFEKNYNTWTGWYVKLLNPNSSIESFNFYAYSKKVIATGPNEDHKFNGALIFVNTHYPYIGLIVKEDKFSKKRKLLLFSSYNARETIKNFNLETLNFKDEVEIIKERD